jgi:tetratricopeptide (TPR) repeat protein
MLETIREFAAEQLDALGDEAEVGRRHARFALEVAESAGLWPESLAAGAGSAGYARIAGELPNLRAAVSRHMARGELEEAATLAVRLENFLVSNAPIEGIALYRELLDRDPGYPPELRVWLLRCLSGTTFITGAFEEGARLSRQALDEYRRLGDVWGEAHMLHRLAVEATLVGDDRKTRELLEQSLALDPGAFNRASSLVVLSKLAEREGRLDEALALAEEGAAAAASIDFHWFQANALHQAADVALRLDRPDVAADRAAKAVRLSHAIGDRMGVAFGLSNLAFAVARHDPVRAGRLWGAVEADSEHARIGQWEQVKDEHVAQLAELAGPEFERGRAEGHTLGIDHAVQDALASLD